LSKIEQAKRIAIVKSDAAIEKENYTDKFRTTRWSIVLSCGNLDDRSVGARDALGQLCRIYWRPIFAFICRRGHSISDAQDLTQDFFLTVLNGDLLQRVDPGRGRFRSVLLKGLKNFLSDAARKRRSLKRGGAVNFVSWDDWLAESPSQLSVPLQAVESWPGESLFDLRWAATVTEQALRRLAEECASRGRRRVFDVLSASLTSERSEVCYASLSATLGVSSATVKRLVHQLRQRYWRLLRDEVARTVENPSDVDDEIRHLCATLASMDKGPQ
jgi:RNA polymerase sigma factor (sigma-70 family)